MGKIIDTAEVDRITKGSIDGKEFDVIIFKNSNNGWTEGRMVVEESKNNKLNPDVWKSGVKVIAVWEESEWDGANCTIISDELYTARINHDDNKWRELISKMTKDELDELDWRNRDKNYNVIYTDKQVSISHYD